ncbi:uncharacterized protein N7473_008602 [Penicillium subrubescens]|jgi:beta-mannosidase|uniref:Beta-mannosidase B n=1 Tax=Penicillium subrubescens TaxID=1316194 RepID=A0A1Q5U027_9EURO|nr:uncharacterized protein N7473_008602 [Penicillium subrubescens]KAJ5885928.1 hypothetical protein N7473_008602 [Penicillium subrubescens]OKP05828.1 Beta-mannosidase B [Penicillium subrubescens]
MVQDACAKIEMRFMPVATGQVIRAPIVKGGRVLTAKVTTEILSGIIDKIHEEPFVLAARLLVDEECISRDVNWPQPLRYLSFEKRGVLVGAMEPGIYKVIDESLTKRLMVYKRDGIELSYNCIDIVPRYPGITRGMRLEKENGTYVPNYRYLRSDDHQPARYEGRSGVQLRRSTGKSLSST